VIAGAFLSERNLVLLEEAAAWRLLGLLFERPREGWAQEISSLAVTLPAEEELQRAALLAAQEGKPGLHESLLGPGGPVSPREVSYHSEVLPGPLLAEITAYYQNFAYAPALVEPPDHVAAKCGFLGFLRMKEAFAQESGLEDQTRVASEAFRSFRDGHLREMAEPLAVSLDSWGPEYLRLASRELLRRTGPRPSRLTPSAGVSEEGCPFPS
jgi:nitrate reductase assembly molybdenum cofactor insertion protein NarJ